jgi:hypothetical protein
MPAKSQLKASHFEFSPSPIRALSAQNTDPLCYIRKLVAECEIWPKERLGPLQEQLSLFFCNPQVISHNRSKVDRTRPTIDEEAGNLNFIDDLKVSLIEVVVRQERWDGMLDQPIAMRALAYSSELSEGEALLRCSVSHLLKIWLSRFLKLCSIFAN